MGPATDTPTRAAETSPSWLDALNAGERRLYERIPEQMDYVSHPCFSSPSTAERLFGGSAEPITVPVWTDFPDIADDPRAVRRKRVSLSAGDEARLFLRYNYARYRLSKLIAAQRRRTSVARARQMLLWFRRVLKLRSDLVQANMALVLAMARRAKIPGTEFAEVVSEGNMALLRAVEKFDVSRGYKFSTYACRAILKSFNRLATNTGRHRQRFPAEFDPDLERSDYDVQKHEMQRRSSVEALREILARNRAHLTDIETTIVMERFGIGNGGRRTLSEVGKTVHLTNERVRQLQMLALEKIRAALEEEFLTA